MEKRIGLPTDSTLPTVLTGQHFEAVDNFVRTFAVKPDDTMVFPAYIRPIVERASFVASMAERFGAPVDPLEHWPG